MTFQDVLRELESLGTEQNRKVYVRHGVGEKMCGVSFGDLNRLKKRIKQDHELAQQLWSTGNHDARVLATMIADPKQLTESLLDRWARDLNNYMLTDAFSAMVAKSTLVRTKMEQWTQSEVEWVGQAGWNLVAHLAVKDKALPDTCFAPYLAEIEQHIHEHKNRVRYSMNNALIAIGMRNDSLEARALDIADSIGTVWVDHGETNCQTPDARAYILKARARHQHETG